jgi:hypothetical protein
MHLSDLLRYTLWVGVATTAKRNQREYGVPTAWLTHLIGNSVTLFLPDVLRILHRKRMIRSKDPVTRALLQTLDLRVSQDPNYALYVAPLALGFIASHPDYSIYHGELGKRKLFGFGLDSIPHAATAYTLARLISVTLETLDAELPPDAGLARPASWAARHVDGLATLAIAIVTLAWETGEYCAHIDELERTGRPESEINMQWSLADSMTDALSNFFGLATAIAVRHTLHADRATSRPSAAHEEASFGRN